MKLVKVIVLFAAIAFVGKVQAQDLKFGHINIQELVMQLPEKVAADQELQAEATKLQEQLQVMQQDLQKKYTDYMSQRDSLPDLIRATKEKEIQDYEQRMQQYSQMAQQTIGQKEQQLLQPIITKVQKAIDEVGQEQGLIYIFDISSQVVVYHSSKSIDCAPLVKTKLGAQ
ncbi:OmpH family outer membrane protein [Carboxylicivirga mesophila]|uniref:OmpH family outer membrane protein n=2 Tax=Carboxylicivirga TaxID=1628153 RepID=A0A941IY07_9BACT|nr:MULTISPECIES: OmpH family outer membrane protein [Carboxylicivirga]MBR8536505.1 OmpH family outer membrane protein [Carboxylicivirga sediminis]MBS2211622.1 OmpH family outer membrane protein [Carboxylicivirga mesophila]